MGTLYRRGRVLWAKWYVDGRPMREGTGVAGDGDMPPKDAEPVLMVREGAGGAGRSVPVRADRIRYEEVRKDLLEHYATTGRRRAEEIGWRLKHLDPFFGGRRVVDITAALATTYVAQRQEHGA